MKKLMLFFAVATAVSFASCGSKQAEATEEVIDSAAVVAEEVIDSAAIVADSVVAEVVDSAVAVVAE